MMRRANSIHTTMGSMTVDPEGATPPANLWYAYAFAWKSICRNMFHVRDKSNTSRVFTHNMTILMGSLFTNERVPPSPPLMWHATWCVTSFPSASIQHLYMSATTCLILFSTDRAHDHANSSNTYVVHMLLKIGIHTFTVAIEWFWEDEHHSWLVSHERRHVKGCANARAAQLRLKSLGWQNRYWYCRWGADV